jgi:hypothetical protein
MNIVSTIILSLVSIPSLTLCMLASSTTPPPSTLDFSQLVTGTEKQVTWIYDTTKDILKRHDKLNLAEHTTNNLLLVMQSVNKLKEQQITERQLALFAYSKGQSLPMVNAHTSNCHVAVFFDRLERFNQHIDKNKFTIPTLEEYKNHLANQQKEKEYKEAINIATICGILISDAAIKHDQHPFIALPMTVATLELEHFIDHITTMCQQDPAQIKTVAELLYVNNQTKL